MTRERDAEAGYRQALGRTIADYRADRGASLRALAEESGLSLSFLSELENGRKDASAESMARLAAAFGVVLPDMLRAVAERLEADQRQACVSLEGLSAEEIEEVARFADWMRWRKSRD